MSGKYKILDNGMIVDEEYIKKIEPNFNSHIERGTIEMNNEYYNLLEEKMARLINKNQELNDQLDRELIKRARLEEKLYKIAKIVDSYNLGKYDYSIPPTGIIELKEILEGKNEKKEC